MNELKRFLILALLPFVFSCSHSKSSSDYISSIPESVESQVQEEIAVLDYADVLYNKEDYDQKNICVSGRIFCVDSESTFRFIDRLGLTDDIGFSVRLGYDSKSDWNVGDYVVIQ